MKRSALLMAVLVSMLALLAPYVSARSETVQDPPKDQAAEEAEAYKAWYEAYNAKNLEKGFELAKAFLAKFPASGNANYIKTYIISTRAALFNNARTAKNTAEEIRLGNEALVVEPDNLDYLWLLAFDIRTNELYASPPVYSHAGEVSDFSRRTIRLIEGGKVPGVVDKAKWNQNQQLGALYHTLGMLEAKNKNAEKAIELYRKATTLDATNPAYFLGLGSLFQEKYRAAAEKYLAFPQADREAPEPKPEVKAALEEGNNYADLVIENWARFTALSAGNDAWKTTRDQVKDAVTPIYNYRHPNDTDGWQKLIERYKTNGAPAASTSRGSVQTHIASRAFVQLG